MYKLVLREKDWVYLLSDGRPPPIEDIKAIERGYKGAICCPICNRPIVQLSPRWAYDEIQNKHTNIDKTTIECPECGATTLIPQPKQLSISS